METNRGGGDLIDFGMPGTVPDDGDVAGQTLLGLLAEDVVDNDLAPSTSRVDVASARRLGGELGPDEGMEDTVAAECHHGSVP